jgi:hypothetical protein
LFRDKECKGIRGVRGGQDGGPVDGVGALVDAWRSAATPFNCATPSRQKGGPYIFSSKISSRAHSGGVWQRLTASKMETHSRGSLKTCTPWRCRDARFLALSLALLVFACHASGNNSSCVCLCVCAHQGNDGTSRIMFPLFG